MTTHAIAKIHLGLIQSFALTYVASCAWIAWCLA